MILSLTGATILVGVDFSEHCERAVLRAVTIAERNNAQVELVHVFEWVGVEPPNADPHAEGQGSNVTQAFWDALVHQAQATRSRLGEICSALIGDRVSAKIRVVIGEPAGALLLAAEHAHVALIVLGAHGRSVAPCGLWGTTAGRLCERSTVPVLLVPGAMPAWTHASDTLFLSSRHSIVCRCSRCGAVQWAKTAAAECAFCRNQPDIWISMKEPKLLHA